MSRRAWYVGFGLFFLRYASYASGQDTPLVDPAPTNFLVQAPDHGAIQGSWRGTLTATQFVVNKFAQEKLNEAIKQMIFKAQTDATPTIRWTGQGVLYELRVATHPAAGKAGWFVGMIVGERPIELGVGASPEQALFYSYLRGGVGTGLPPEFKLDPLYSTYLWVSKTPTGKIETKPVAKGTLQELNERTREQYGDLELKYQADKMKDYNSWLQIAATAKSRLTEKSAQSRVSSALQEVEDSRARVAGIRKRLDDALEKEKRATGAVLILQTLRTVLDVASFTQVAISETGAPASVFDGANSPSAVLKRVEVYRDESITVRKTTELQFNTDAEGLQRSLNEFWESVKPANPPGNIKGTLRVRPPWQ